MKQFQILDMNALTVSAKHFAISAGDPGQCRSKTQVSDLALGPTVDSGGPLAATLADGLKAFVGFHMDMSPGCLGGDRLIDNFDSTKGEIRCYTEYGHRRPPWDNVCLCRLN